MKTLNKTKIEKLLGRAARLSKQIENLKKVEVDDIYVLSVDDRGAFFTVSDDREETLKAFILDYGEPKITELGGTYTDVQLSWTIHGKTFYTFWPKKQAKERTELTLEDVL